MINRLDDFQFLHESEVGKVIRKSTQQPLTDADCTPEFIDKTFNADEHQKYLDDNLHIGEDVPTNIKQELIDLIKEFWCIFDEDNVMITIKGYQCVIDTGENKPTVARNIRYGIHETPIMEKAIHGLLSNNQIEADTTSSWLSQIILAPKPHQEHIRNIKEFVW